MALNPADWTVDRATGNIRYIGTDHGVATPGYVTVIELHRWLQDLADDAVSSGDDDLDITDDTPSERSTDNIITLINGYNIDDTAAEHIYDGSIIQDNLNTYYDGIVNFGNTTNIQIIQNGAVITDDWWNSGGGLNADATAGISHRFMIKTRTGGSDIDGRRLIGTSRQWGKTFSEFKINGSTRGNNVLALSESDDLNNDTAVGTVATWTTITNTSEGYNLIDVENDAAPEPFYSAWDKASFSIKQFYERMKYLTREGSAETLYGLNGELFRGITHEINVDTPTGTFNAFEAVSWATGTGQMLAINSTTAATKMWIQLLTGLAPTDGQTITGGTSSATVDVNVTVTDRPISTPFVGASTGSAILGAYGVGIEYADLTAADSLTDLGANPLSPPNNVTFTVLGLVSGDRVLVGPEDGALGLDYDQLTLNTSLTTDDITSVVVTTAIPADTPSTGYIRVQDNDGVYRRLHYSAWSTSTFTIDTTDGNEDFATVQATAPKNVFIAYIDIATATTSESFTTVFDSPRTLFVRVRDGGVDPIKTFETTGTLGSAGGSTTAIRTSDE